MLNPGDRFGDYTVVRLLGKGGMGSVHLLETAEGARVAAKILDPATAGDHESRKRFVREAELALGVRHPNLVETYDVGEDPETGLCYILMEYVSGGSLADYLKEHGALPIEDAVAVVQAMASVLELARQKGIVHRDIKPANIMFDAEGTPKLADLGIARGGLAGTETTTVTQTGMMIGTPAYMAPEQMLDAHKVDTRADIYSLGVVFFEMLTGERPNKDDTVVQLMAKAVKGEPLPDVRTLRPEVSASLAQLLNMMVAPDKDGRIATPGQITSALDLIERGGTFAAKPTVRASFPDGRALTQTVPQTSRDRKSLPWKTLIPIGLIAGLAVAFGILAPDSKRSVSPPLTTNGIERVVEKTNVVERISVVTNVPTPDPAVGGNRALPKTVRLNAGNVRQQANVGSRTWFFADVADGVILCCAEDRALRSKPCADPLPEGRLEIPQRINGRPVIGIGRFAFSRCAKLKEVVIPDYVRTIDHGAFHGCRELESVILPPTLVSLTGEAFRNCAQLARLSFAKSSDNFMIRDGVLYSAQGDVIVFCPPVVRTLPCLLPTVTRIGNGAFCGCAIERAVLPDGITEIEKGAFSFCTNLRTVELPRSLKRIGGFAFGYAGLREIVIPEGVCVIEGETFRGCASLKSIVLPDSLQEIRGHATFEGCSSLCDLELKEGLRVLGESQLFGFCKMLKRLVVPASVRMMSGDEGTFMGCRALSEVVFCGDAPTLTGFAGERTGMFKGSPEDVRVVVGRHSHGWNGLRTETLPATWPVGAGGNARTIRYADEDVGPNADKKTFDSEKLKDPNSTRTVQKALDRELQDARGSRQDKGPRYTEEGLLEEPVFDAARFADRDSTRRVQKTLDALFPGWKTTKNAEKAVHPNEEIGYISDICGRHDVLATLPPSRQSPVRLTRTMVVPEGAKLSLAVRKNPTAGGGLMLEVYANGKRRWEGVVTDGEWFEHAVDLSDLAGKKARLEVRHMIHPDFGNARALWSDLSVR